MNPFTVTRTLAAGLATVAGASLLSLLISGEPLSAGVTVGTPGASGGFELGVSLTGLSSLLLIFLASVSWLVASYASRNLAGQQRYGRFALLMTMATLGLAVMVAGASLPVIAAGWTASGLAIAGLVGHAPAQTARRASRYVRSWFLVADVALWAGVVAGLALLPSVDRDATFEPGVATTAVAVVLLLAAVIRSALFPASRWLPETAEAPSPLSAFLHAGIVNGAGLLVLLMWPLFSSAPVVLGALIVIGTASVIVGTWRGRVRADVKGKLASSTTAQMGYMAIQLGIGLPAAALLHLMGHGYYKAWLFLRAGGVVTRARWQGRGTRREADLHRNRPRQALLLMGALALASLLALPAVVESVVKLGPAAVLPALLALSAVGVATWALAGRRGRVSAAALAAGIGALYLWLLLGWETLLAGAFDLTAVWSAPVATVWLVFVALAGTGAAVGAAQLDRGRMRGLWLRLALSTLPPDVARGLRRSKRVVHPMAPAAAVADGFDAAEAAALVEISGSVVGPAWPLRDLVAVNHLAGTVGLPFADIDATAREVHGASIYSAPADYLRLFESGDIPATVVEATLERSARTTPESMLPATLGGLIDATRAAATQPDPHTRNIREEADVDPVAAVTGLWCRAAWSAAHTGQRGPWTLLRQAAAEASSDRAVDALCGRTGAAAWLRSLPVEPLAALAILLGSRSESERALDVGFAAVRALPGWAGHAQWRARGGNDDALASLVATYVAVSMLFRAPLATAESTADPLAPQPRWEPLAEVWQQALEANFRDPLVAGVLAGAQHGESWAAQPVVRASLVFCIDVRSERMRRAIERTGPYLTYGYAGFFGAALRYQTDDGAAFDQCPALISPTRSVSVAGDAADNRGSLRHALRQAQNVVSSAAVLPLVVAEFGGLLAGAASAAANRMPVRWRAAGQRWGSIPERWGPRDLDLPGETFTVDRVSAGRGSAPAPAYGIADLTGMARDFLRLTGATAPFGELIVIVGHGATVENNAFAAGYDCGACGGNSGHINARVLAHALNHPEVRANLAAEGWHLPDSCSAIAAVHDTTTDEITFDPYSVVDRGALAALSADLEEARDAVIAERLPLLPTAPDAQGSVARAVAARRGTDWAQPVPEWGLAGNAAFIVGPRQLTAHLDLQGRVFLHSYDAAADDADSSALRTILTAPVVVAHWINSQYYLSTVAPTVFGAGDKTTHNVVGDVGVTSGAHGDLRLGLPWQAVRPEDPANRSAAMANANGAGLVGHQALRLLVVVAAEPSTVAKIVAEDVTLSGLLASSWITIVACPNGQPTPLQLTADLRWRPWHRDEGRTASGGNDLPLGV